MLLVTPNVCPFIGSAHASAGNNNPAQQMSNEHVQAKIWPVPSNLDTFCYPELREGVAVIDPSRKDFGIALCGGSVRAETLSLGWLRGLHELEVLRSVRYISSTSGGSWTNAAYSYCDDTISDAEFFGEYVPPEKFTREHLVSNNGKMGTVIADANLFSGFMSQIGKGVLMAIPQALSLKKSSPMDSWSRAVANCYFKPFDMKSNTLLPTLNPNRPFAIVCASCPVEHYCMNFVPLEMTAMYYGIPVPDHKQNSRHIGGVLIEPHAFTSQPSKSCLQRIREIVLLYTEEEATVSVPPPRTALSVAHQAGLSSHAIADVMAAYTMVLKHWFVPTVPTWNLNSTGRLKVVDGGANDNLGIYPLLRRGVKNIVCCVPNHNKISSDSMLTDDDASSVAAVAGLFGRMNAYSAAVEGNVARVVFRGDDWDVVVKGLRDSHSAVGSCFYLYKGTVLRNDLIGVRGGYDVKVLFVVFTDSKQWIDQLSDDLKEYIKSEQAKAGPVNAVKDVFGGDASLASFPYPSTAKLNYSPELVNALTQLSCWQIMQCRDALREMGMM